MGKLLPHLLKAFEGPHRATKHHFLFHRSFNVLSRLSEGWGGYPIITILSKDIKTPFLICSETPELMFLSL